MEKWLLGFLVILLAGRGAMRSYEDALANDIRGRLTQQEGSLRVRLEPEGVFGFFSGHLDAATLSAEGIGTDGLPFWTEPDYSRYARVDLLKIRLRYVTVTGLDVLRLEADIPDCRYDRGLAAAHRRIRLTESGIGTGRVEVTAKALADFVMRKYPIVTDLVFRLSGGRFEATGTVSLFGRVPFRAVGELGIEGGVKVVIANAVVTLGERELDETATRGFLTRLNPVLHEDADLHLLDTIFMRKLTLENDLLIVEGTAKIPVKSDREDKGVER